MMFIIELDGLAEISIFSHNTTFIGRVADMTVVVEWETDLDNWCHLWLALVDIVDK